MEWADILKIYGPMGIGWIGFAYIGKFVMDRYDKDIDAKVKLSTALDALTKMIERLSNEKRS